MKDKVVVITGASDGIGAAAAVALHRMGATVVPVGRSPEKTARTAALVDAEPRVADFTNLDSVRALAAGLVGDFDRIDVLMNNAGGTWPHRQLTVDGHETTFQLNHLAPFLLTNLLRDRLRAGRARVVTTSSAAHMMGHVRLDDLDSSRWYLEFTAYGTTKLENILFTSELARRWADDGVTAASVHPGVVATSFGRDSAIIRFAYQTPAKRLMRTPEQGADSLVWLASAPPSEWRNGGYHADRKPARVRGQATSVTLAGGLWERSAALVDLPA